MRHPVIGLTGLPCTGKSFVGGIFVGLGAAVLHTDPLGHGVLEEPDVKQAVVERFGPELLDADGRVDRGRLAHHVFATPSPDDGEDLVPPELAWLESVMHPRIHTHVQAWIAARRHRQPVVIEAALLVQSGIARDCDVILVLEADEQVRRERAAGHRQWTAAMLASRDRRLRPVLESLRDPGAVHALGLEGRLVFLENNSGVDAAASMEQLLIPLRKTLEPLP